MILTIGPGGCGFTFVNWSIAYLRGDSSYVSLDGKTWPVDINPLIGSTAHNFKKDHLKIETSRLILNRANDLSIIYISPGSQHDFEQILCMPGKKIIFNNHDHAQELLARSLMTMPRCGHGIELLFDQLAIKFGDAAARRGLLENAKLLVQFYQVPSTDQSDIFLIGYEDIFKNFHDVVVRLLSFLQISIDLRRQRNWSTIYDSYRQNNQNFVERFVDGQASDVDISLRKSIFKEIYRWTHGGHHLISNS